MDLPNPGIKPGSPALQAYSLPTELSGKPLSLEKQKYEIGCIGEGKRNKLTLPISPLSQNRWVPGENFSACDFSLREKGDHAHELLTYPAMWEVPSCPVLSHPIQSNPIQSTELWAMCWGWGKKRFAEIGFSEGINGMWILLTVSQIPSRSLPMNCWVHFILRSLRWHTGTMNLPCASPFAAFFGQLSVHSPGGSESKLWQMGSEHTQKTHPNLLQKDHKIEL